jgi:prepilin-type processing-associated H-X9-DG protein
MRNTLQIKRSKSSVGAKGFTLVELFVVIATLALLASLAAPAFSRVEGASRVVQCAGNLRQLTLATEIYAYENKNALPTGAGGYWDWDTPPGTTDSLIRSGATRNNFYCPANPQQNNDGLWHWPNGRVTGYAQTFSGAPGLSSSNINTSIVPVPVSLGPVSYTPPRANARVLFADATISMNGQSTATPAAEATYQWSGIPGGYSAPGWPGHRTAHLNGLLPAGGNVAMLDGHVEWRAFSRMIPRNGFSSSSGFPSPVFWW